MPLPDRAIHGFDKVDPDTVVIVAVFLAVPELGNLVDMQIWGDGRLTPAQAHDLMAQGVAAVWHSPEDGVVMTADADGNYTKEVRRDGDVG